MTCASAGDCWAAGGLLSTGDSPPLIEHDAGSSWAIVSTASPSPGLANPSSSYLKGVTCTSPADCWAVGDTLNIQGDQPLIEHFVGSSWAIVSTANPN